MAKFIIMALPRSRTKWTATWLEHEGRHSIGHDLAVDCSSVEDFLEALDAVDGSVETGAILGWRLLRQLRPRLRLVTLARPFWQVLASLEALGLGPANREDMELRANMLAALAYQPGVENFLSSELSVESRAKHLWEFCLGVEFAREWWKETNAKNIQIDMRERVLRLAANSRDLELLRADLISQTAALAAPSLGLH